MISTADSLLLVVIPLFSRVGFFVSASSKLFNKLGERGLHLITHIRGNMKNKLMTFMDKILLRKRSLIETVNDQLKNIAQIEHTRHRSLTSFSVNLLSALIAYTYQPKKPTLKLDYDFIKKDEYALTF